MGRKLRSTLPILPARLKPSWKALRGLEPNINISGLNKNAILTNVTVFMTFHFYIRTHMLGLIPRLPVASKVLFNTPIILLDRML